jgi:hypothetical protein
MTLNSLNTTLFENTSANFRLAVNVMFNKQNSQTKQQYPLVRVSQNGNAKCEPNVFLVWTYTEGSFDTDVSVYTSNPHLLRLRNIFEEMKEGILSGSAFIDSNNGLVINDNYANNYSITNIGVKSNWISFRFIANALVDSTNNYIPGVELTLSNAPKPCLLTIDEFLSIYTIIKDISLPQIALTASALALLSNNNQQAAPSYSNRQNNYGGYNSARPAYNNQYNNQQNYQRQAAPATNTGYATRGQAAQPQQYAPQENISPSYNNNSSFEPKRSTVQSMPPRSSKPTMTDFDAIESIPTDDFSVDDVESLADLFSSEE